MGNKHNIGDKVPGRHYTVETMYQGMLNLPVRVGDVVACKGYYIVIGSKGRNDLSLLKLDENNGKCSCPGQEPPWFTGQTPSVPLSRLNVKYLCVSLRCGVNRSWEEYCKWFEENWKYQQQCINSDDNRSITWIGAPHEEQVKIIKKMTGHPPS